MSTTQTIEALGERITLAMLSKMTGLSVEDILSRVVLDAPKTIPALSTDEENEKVHIRAPVRRVVTPRAARATPSRRDEKVDTRSQAGREAYDAAVLEYLQKAGKPCKATEIRDAVGGTPQQFRASVNRHIDSGEVSYEGQARATRYTWVGND